MSDQAIFGTTRRYVKHTFAASAAIMLAACSNAENTEQANVIDVDLAITGVSIIDVKTGETGQNQSIYVDDGKIVAIEPNGSLIYAAEKTVDQSGHYAVPGLWDMHIHLRGGKELLAENELFLSHFTGYGITGVRDAAGDLPNAVRTWREEIDDGERTGPTIFTSYQKLDGPNPTWDGSIPVDTAEDIPRALDILAAQNPDFIKVYTSTLKQEMYLPLLEAIEERGIDSSAHLHFGVPFRASVAAGLDSIEHALYLHKGASPEDEAISAALARGERISGVFGRLIDIYDEAHFNETLRLMREAGTALTPTLYVDHLLRFFDENDHADDDRLSIIPESIKETYKGRVESALRRSPEQIAADHHRMTTTMSLIPAVDQAGVMLLAGSDTGAFNSYVYPGDSLHQEMRMMQEAGLSPLTVLQAATINGAAFLHQADHYGSIEVGKNADILLLAANPLDDINNTRSIAGLVQNGIVLAARQLETLRNKRLDE